MPALYTPPDFDLRSVILALSHSGLSASSDYRRKITRFDPLLFALVYLIGHLRSNETESRVSLCDFHIDIAEAAARWSRKDLGPAELRECWVAPRESGKTTWMFLILPLWALAHGHRRFAAMFADSGDQAEMHLNNLRKEFESNEWLRKDFPDLCDPAVRRGNRSDSDSAKMYVSRSGATIMARGIDSRTLGAKSGNVRPDLIVLDDIEPKGSSYNVALKGKRLKDLIDAVFPMNLNAVVQIAGTTVMFGSIIHDLVRASDQADRAAWVTEQNIVTRHYLPIITDPDGSERSLWPERWSLEYLQSVRGTRTYALNFANTPLSSDGGYWDRGDFRYRAPWVPARMILSLDPATTSRQSSDYTGVSVISTNAAGREAQVEWAVGVKLPPAKLRALAHDLINRNPRIDTVLVETNQGGDTWATIMLPLPRASVRLITIHETAPKHTRIQQLLDYYGRGWVWHGKPLPALEEQQVAYPNVNNDDIVDSVAKGVHHYLKDRAIA